MSKSIEESFVDWWNKNSVGVGDLDVSTLDELSKNEEIKRMALKAFKAGAKVGYDRGAEDQYKLPDYI